jgi:HPt (histidine-containing phosphotransfer) domain-containing protein
MSEDFDRGLLREFAAACSTPGFYATFVHASLADLQTACEALEDAGERGAAAEFLNHAHAIKGLAATIGALRLVAAIDAAVARAGNGMHEGWRDDVHALRNALQRALLAVDQALAAALSPP